MNGSDDRQRAGVDDAKRVFLKKLAIGTAYAVPTIATFSLDGVRNKARAQTSYGEPAVLSVRAVPAAAGDYLYGEPPNPFMSAAPYVWVITYDRPMNPDYANAKICKVESIDYSCGTPPPTSDPVPSEACGALAELTWSWSPDNTQEFADIPYTGSTASQRLTVWLNHPSCSESAFYRDTHGTALPAFIGVADLCSPPTPG